MTTMSDKSLRCVSDCHCHIHTSCTLDQAIGLSTALREGCLLKNYAIMSTNHLDIDIIDSMVKRSSTHGASSDLVPSPIVPFFGIHPWYSHLFATLSPDAEEAPRSFKVRHYSSILYPPPTSELLEVLPEPIPLDAHVARLKSILATYVNPEAVATYGIGIGEIGLDKPFRIPTNGYFGNATATSSSTEGKGDDASDNVRLSPCRVKMDHQVQILQSQLQLAQEYSLPVSMHCVKAHGILFETCMKYDIPSVILHSYSGSVDQAKVWMNSFQGSGKKNKSTQKGKLYFSLSYWINGTDSKSETLHQLVSMLTNENILLETDMSLDYTSQEKHSHHIQSILEKVCSIKGWTEDQGKDIVCSNWANCIETGTKVI